MSVDPFRNGDGIEQGFGAEMASVVQNDIFSLYQNYSPSFDVAPVIPQASNASQSVGQRLGVAPKIEQPNGAALKTNLGSQAGISKNLNNIDESRDRLKGQRANFVEGVKGAQQEIVTAMGDVEVANGITRGTHLPSRGTSAAGGVVNMAINAAAGAAGDAVEISAAVLNEGSKLPPAEFAKLQVRAHAQLVSAKPGSANSITNETATPAPVPQSQRYAFEKISPEEAWKLVEDMDVTQQPEIMQIDRALAKLDELQAINELAAVKLEQQAPGFDSVQYHEMAKEAVVAATVQGPSAYEIVGARADLSSLSGVVIGATGVGVDPAVVRTLQAEQLNTLPPPEVAQQASLSKGFGMNALGA